MRLTTTWQVRVQWGDCDAAKIVFYPNYFRWFDAATNVWQETLGGGLSGLRDKYGLVALPLLEAHANFLRSTRFGDELVIETHLDSWERKVLRLRHRISVGGETAVEGLETRAWCIQNPNDPDALKAAAIPDEVVALFQR